MAEFSMVTDFIVELYAGHFLMAVMVQHRTFNGHTLQLRIAECRFGFSSQQDIVKDDLFSGLNIELFDGDCLVSGDEVLLATCAYNCVHRKIGKVVPRQCTGFAIDCQPSTTIVHSKYGE